MTENTRPPERDEAARRERARARRPGMELRRFSRKGIPVAVASKLVARARAGEGRLFEDGSFVATPRARRLPRPPQKGRKE